MKDWSSALTHTVAGMIQLYEQLLSIKGYPTQKTKTTQGDVICRLCDKEAETFPHILSGCSTLTQSKKFGSTQCCSEDILLREV